MVIFGEKIPNLLKIFFSPMKDLLIGCSASKAVKVVCSVLGYSSNKTWDSSQQVNFLRNMPKTRVLKIRDIEVTLDVAHLSIDLKISACISKAREVSCYTLYSLLTSIPLFMHILAITNIITVFLLSI